MYQIGDCLQQTKRESMFFRPSLFPSRLILVQNLPVRVLVEREAMISELDKFLEARPYGLALSDSLIVVKEWRSEVLERYRCDSLTLWRILKSNLGLSRPAGRLEAWIYRS